MTRNRLSISAASAALIALAATGSSLLSGCGGSGSRGAGTDSFTVTKSKTTGQLTLAIKWPTRTASQTRVIPTATTAIQLQVVSQSGIFTSTGTNTFTSPSIPYGTATYTVSSVPAGSATVSASAVLQQPSTGAITLATVAPTTIGVVAQQVTPLNLTLVATLTTSTTAISATIQKVLNPDGSAVSPTDPTGQPQSLAAVTFLSPFETLQDKAVYEVVATIASTTPTTATLPLPTASEFSFDIENDYDLTGTTSAFLTAVDATGKPLNVRPAVGNVAYFKINAAGSNGELYIPLNATLFSDPSTYTAPYTVYYLAAPGFVP